MRRKIESQFYYFYQSCQLYELEHNPKMYCCNKFDAMANVPPFNLHTSCVCGPIVVVVIIINREQAMQSNPCGTIMNLQRHHNHNNGPACAWSTLGPTIGNLLKPELYSWLTSFHLTWISF